MTEERCFQIFYQESIPLRLIDQGSVYSIDEMLEHNETWLSLPDGMRNMYKIDDQIWALPDSMYPYYYIRWYNSEWLKNLDLQVPDNLDSLYEACSKFTFNDPDGNNMNDTKGMTLTEENVIDIFNEYGCYLQKTNTYEGAITSIAYDPIDGVFKDCMENDDIYMALNYLKLLFDEGLADYHDYSQHKDMIYGSDVKFYDLDDIDLFNKSLSMGFENGYTTPVFYNMKGGFYVLGKNTENPQIIINKFIDVIYGYKEGYYSAQYGGFKLQA